MVSIRTLSAAELTLAKAMDISEEGDVVYRLLGGELIPQAGNHSRRFQTEEDWAERIRSWRSALEAGGTALGASEGTAFSGLAVVTFDAAPGTAQLFALYIDREHRRIGVGSRLLAEAEELARGRGAAQMFVSAVPHGSAAGFYLSRGFRPDDRADLPTLQQAQDIPMTKPI